MYYTTYADVVKRIYLVIWLVFNWSKAEFRSDISKLTKSLEKVILYAELLCGIQRCESG